MAVNGDREDGDGFRRVSEDKNVRTRWEACEATGLTLDDDCEATETTTIEKSMNGALHPNLNRECVRPSDTCLPQCGAQLPASKSTPPTNRAHSPLSEEGSITWEIPLPPADIHSWACRRLLGTHESLGSSNITRGSTSLLHPTTCEHVTSMGGAEPLKGLQPPVYEQRERWSRGQTPTSFGCRTSDSVTCYRTGKLKKATGLPTLAKQSSHPRRSDTTHTLMRCAPLGLPRLTPRGLSLRNGPP